MSLEKEVKAAFKSNIKRMKTGCAWFIWQEDVIDRHPQNASGWYSVEGAQAAWFNSFEDLPPNVVWWTNLSKTEAWSTNKANILKYDGFLGTDWLSLLSRWGKPSGVEDLKKSIAIYSELFTRVNTKLNNIFSKSDALSPEWSWLNGEDLMELLGMQFNFERINFSESINSETPPYPDKAFLKEIDANINEFLLKDKRKITLPIYPIEHFKFITNTKIPHGKWSEIPKEHYPKNDDSRWQYIQDNIHKPMIVAFLNEPVARIGQERALKALWGTRGKTFAGDIYKKVWLTAEEAIEFMECSKTAPTEVWIAEGWQDIPNNIKNIIQLEDVIDNSLLTNEIILTALWKTLAYPFRGKTRRKNAPNSMNVWLSSRDRLHCIKKIKKILKYNIDITSYGNGRLQFAFNNNDLSIGDWQSILKDAETVTPLEMSKVCNIPINPIDSEKSLNEWLILREQPVEAWIMLDRLITPNMIYGKNALKESMSESLKTITNIPIQNNSSKEKLRAMLIDKSRQSLEKLLQNK